MLTLPRKVFVVATTACCLAMATGTGTFAQDQSMALRMSNMEERMRQLNGQIEQLTMELRQLGAQMQRLQKDSEYRLQDQGPSGKQASAMEGQQDQAAATQPVLPDPNGVERINPDNELSAYQTGELDEMGGANQDVSMSGVIERAPGPKPLGTLPSGSMNGGAAMNSGNSEADPYSPNQVETASLDGSAMASASPEQLYERSYESLLRRRYGEAEAGFRTFIDKHADHELAGNAEFWLGETYYVQSDYKQAAQAFLAGYQNYPDNRKAPDSLLRLGMSLARLGQKDQACSAFSTVGTKFPKAAETLKRAQNESTKAGC